VVAVLDYYDPADLGDWFQYHKSDRFGTYVMTHIDLTNAGINALSGPINTTAYEVAAFGTYDRNVVATQSMAGFRRELPKASLYTYAGPHRVGISRRVGQATGSRCLTSAQ
jgi:hypothetical protein